MVEYDPQERELVKTLDKKIIPFLAVLYLCVLLDRSVQLHTRITNPATKAGLAQDMNLSDSDFSWSLIAFALGSILAALPATLIFRIVGPSRWFEELATRLSYIISCASAVASMSGLITHYLSRADGILGLSGWQWVFVVQGVLGIVMGAVTWMMLPDFPETCHFLQPADRVLAASRGRDGADDDTSLLTTGITKKTRVPIFRFHMIQLIDSVKDVRVWLLALAYFLVSTALDCLITLSPEVVVTSFEINLSQLRNATGNQLDIIIGDNNDGSIPAILLSTAPYLLASLIAYTVSCHSDFTGERAMHASIPLVASGVGFVCMAILPPKYPGAGPARYFMGLLPAIGGLMIAMPCILSYAMEKSQGDTHRATTAVITVIFGNSLGIALAGRPDLFQESDAPTYPIACTISALATGVAAALIMLVRWLNNKEEGSAWGKAPGLRRLLNDVDEAKAWDVELTNLDFLKTEGNYHTEMDSPAPCNRWSEDQEFESL
ncbi:hypothetical protein BASA61_009901 [Batrachochytrium salamandrivorans]|nr:hypothetical protein BASA61_009901 [Batrachochytrium salamandrivorans]KAH9272221.1 hypothetical protein BASA83_005563 [Batrachochytrium salamandrivorans]